MKIGFFLWVQDTETAKHRKTLVGGPKTREDMELEKDKGLKNDVARLERAGSEYSGWIEKLRKAVDGLAAFLAKTYNMQGGDIIQLPGSFTFQWWPSREYQLLGYTSDPDNRVMQIFLSSTVKERKSLLKFACIVADGWLNEVAAHIEKQTTKFREAAEGVDQLVVK